MLIIKCDINRKLPYTLKQKPVNKTVIDNRLRQYLFS